MLFSGNDLYNGAVSFGNAIAQQAAKTGISQITNAVTTAATGGKVDLQGELSNFGSAMSQYAIETGTSMLTQFANDTVNSAVRQVNNAINTGLNSLPLGMGSAIRSILYSTTGINLGSQFMPYTNSYNINPGSKLFSFDPGDPSYSPGYYSDMYGPNINDEILFAHGDGYFGTTDWVNFDRFYSVDLNKEGPSGRHYVFFCRPDLNLIDPITASRLNSENGVSEDPFYQYLADYYPQIISSLTAEFRINATGSRIVNTVLAMAGSGLGNSKYDVASGLPIHAFIPFLTGRVESIQLPDYTIKTEELRQPLTKYSFPYATSAIESQTGGDFEVTFRDDKYFSIRKLFYAWIYYMDGVMRNKFSPKDKYINYNCIDYATSIYDILVDDTGENIMWWSKYTGCIPTSVPISDLSFNRGSAPDNKVSIPFKYFHYEPLSYAALMDFNYNSLGYRYMRTSPTTTRSFALTPSLSFASTYNTNPANNCFLGSNFVGRPAIYMDTKTGGLKLKWVTS